MRLVLIVTTATLCAGQPGQGQGGSGNSGSSSSKCNECGASTTYSEQLLTGTSNGAARPARISHAHSTCPPRT